MFITWPLVKGALRPVTSHKINFATWTFASFFREKGCKIDFVILFFGPPHQKEKETKDKRIKYTIWYIWYSICLSFTVMTKTNQNSSRLNWLSWISLVGRGEGVVENQLKMWNIRMAFVRRRWDPTRYSTFWVDLHLCHLYNLHHLHLDHFHHLHNFHHLHLNRYPHTPGSHQSSQLTHQSSSPSP